MSEPASWLEVSRGALTHNLRTLRQLCGTDSLLAPVVKANAYGHGLVLCGRTFAEAGADWLCVNELAEVTELRDAGLSLPIYVVGPTRAEDAPEIAALGCHVVTSDPRHAQALAVAGRSQGREVPVHVKIETGTHRQGLPPAEARALCDAITESQGIRLAGVTTHLADVEDETEHTFARVQLDRFEAATAGLPSAVLRHAASSAAHLLLPRARYDLVRPGIASYGLWPSRETQISASIVHGADFTLRPALTWKTRLLQIHEGRVGDYVGYGRTLRLSRPSRLGLIPVGYYDGYDRGLSSRGEVLVGGARARVAGRVCMNMTMIDVTDSPAREGDEVILFGLELPVEELANHLQTINYEVTTRVHPRLPRLAGI